jgi:hypothetical protein
MVYLKTKRNGCKRRVGVITARGTSRKGAREYMRAKKLVVMFVAAVVMVVAVAAPVSAQVYYDGCWAWDPYWGWYYWCDDDGTYWVSPCEWYEYPNGPNGPVTYYNECPPDVSYNF